MFKKKYPIIFDVSMDTHIAVMKIGGHLDSTNIEGVTARFNEVVDTKSHKIIIDLSELHYISSIWLGEFMNFSRYIASKDGEVILIKMDKKIHRVFDVLGFSDNFVIMETYEEAKEALLKK